MKKVLFASTALVVAMAAGAASAAEPIKLSVGGFTKQWFGYADQDAENINETFQKSDTEIFFSGATTLDNGLQVGVRFEMEADRSTANRNGDEAFAFVASQGLGRLEIGQVQNFAHKGHNRAPTVGYGFNDAHEIILPAGDAAILAGRTSWDSGKGGKVQYMTPSFGGFQAFAGFTPNAIRLPGGGNESQNIVQDKTTGHNAWEVGAVYAGEFAGFGIKADAGYGQFDGGRTTAGVTTPGLRGWQVGTQLTYAGFTFGGSYVDVAERDAPAGTNIDITSWDLGVGYAMGPFGVSAAYLDSRVDLGGGSDDRGKVWELAGSYAMGPGITSRTSFIHADWEEAGAGGAQNEGWAIVTGLDIRF
ncbi:porin [Telmatospirillum sp. J64-1]|uniref:porin n=1 Tax=Telmatospirillum sp. J64-1 TaxID=2502183 RepID=UPI00115D2485|nr:porin [Telmatospirillum sp. J64-1]